MAHYWVFLPIFCIIFSIISIFCFFNYCNFSDLRNIRKGIPSKLATTIGILGTIWSFTQVPTPEIYVRTIQDTPYIEIDAPLLTKVIYSKDQSNPDYGTEYTEPFPLNESSINIIAKTKCLFLSSEPNSQVFDKDKVKGQFSTVDSNNNIINDTNIIIAPQKQAISTASIDYVNYNQYYFYSKNSKQDVSFSYAGPNQTFDIYLYANRYPRYSNIGKDIYFEITAFDIDGIQPSVTAKATILANYDTVELFKVDSKTNWGFRVKTDSLQNLDQLEFLFYNKQF